MKECSIEENKVKCDYTYEPIKVVKNLGNCPLNRVEKE